MGELKVSPAQQGFSANYFSIVFTCNLKKSNESVVSGQDKLD